MNAGLRARLTRIESRRRDDGPVEVFVVYQDLLNVPPLPDEVIKITRPATQILYRLRTARPPLLLVLLGGNDETP